MPLPPQKTSGAREQGANVADVADVAVVVVVGSVFVWLVMMMKLHGQSPTSSSSSAGETVQIVFVRVQQPQSQGDVAHVDSSSVLMRRSAVTATLTVNDDSGGNHYDDADTETNTETNTASGHDADCTSHELIWKSGAVLFVKRTVGSELSSSSWSWRPPSVGSAMLCFFLVVEALLTFFGQFCVFGANLSILVGKRSEFDIVDTPVVGWWCRSTLKYSPV